ncbi:hypothetical protein EPUS_02302 [Endocarpon pusillum Z07020]|uniref:AAA+ ATPase domain-containing protein n=1 Tax=Endocarpon pusillum (strain Z07020 / HMAS-L-300199) TaxID=1263415 RepID=U1GWA5_ENDPU|nr:uncharacterized protein EPUS_02302 [Endocarpon pusillum Z07020]ERF76763.1 hypothetical protein EPUS_02302 [Endocarpon pusillum Z07020]
MSARTKFTVRPLSRPPRSDLKDALRVNISASALLSLKLRPGDLCLLQQDASPERPAIAWQAVEKIQDNVIQISKMLQDLYGLKLGDKISLSNTNTAVQDAHAVKVREVVELESSPPIGPLSDEDRAHWAWLLYDPLSRAECLMCGLHFDSVQARGQKRNFIISKIDGVDSHSSSTICRFTPATTVSILSRADQPASDRMVEGLRGIKLDETRIGGLRRQLDQINLLLRRFEPQFQNLTRHYNYQPSQGLLLYGPKGTGKSLVIDTLADIPWRSVIRWSAVSLGRNDLAEQLLNRFSESLHQQPCLMIIEQLEILACKRGTMEDSSYSSLVPALRQGLELIRKAAVLVVAEVRHPNNIDDSLRAQTRFGIEIELPVPAANGRLEIMRCIRGNADQPDDAILQDVADRTHGYVGADLFALYQRILETAAHRTLALQENMEHQLNSPPLGSSTHQSSHPFQPDSQPNLTILSTDINTALSSTRPTAMQEVFLETPNIHWSDIGGQQHTKQRLQRAVTRPIRNQSSMQRLNLRTNRGVLLYGPPGCSKTLLAKALATESGLNFLAVKGAELVSTYVGESERAVREVFRKARAASPSIIFFDEFDSIASVRSGGGSSSPTGGSNLNILTTLLNEMDGFEQLRNVLIVAATNRPEILDPALLRPGRLDNLVYVGPPDVQARKEILRLWLKKSDAAEDVDVDLLAEMTEGYSGAEMVSICETAGGFAMDDEEVEQGSGEGEEEGGDGGGGVKIGMDHLRRAVGEVRRGITDELVRGYVDWGTGRGGT